MNKPLNEIKPLNSMEDIIAIFPNWDAAFKNTIRYFVQYTRLSQVDQNNKQYSLEIQPDEVAGYAKSKGLTISKTYCDPDYSGKNSDRPALKELINDIIAGKVDCIIVHRLDRLYRNLESLLAFMRFLEAHNVQLISVTEDINTKTIWGRLLVYVLGAFAELWVRQTSERLREMKEARARKGLTNASFVFGYCKGHCFACQDPNGKGCCPRYGQPDRPENNDGRILVPHPIESEAVRLITRMYSQGYSYREIARHMNSHRFQLPDGQMMQFRTKGNPGRSKPGEFSADAIRNIVSNPFHAGVVARYQTPPLDMTDDLLRRIGGENGQ